VVNNTPPQGAKSPFEPKVNPPQASIGATKPEPSNVKASPELERMIYMSTSSGPQSFSAIQPACLPETIPSAPVSAVPPSSWVASIRAAAEVRIEQEEVEFRAIEESIMAEISRLQNLIAEQKGDP
jgi:hypothetical protein